MENNLSGSGLQYKYGTYTGNGTYTPRFYVGVFPTQMTYITIANDEVYASFKRSDGTGTMGSNTVTAPYFDDTQAIVFNFNSSTNYGSDLDACVCSISASSTGTSSSTNTSKLLYIYSDYINGYFSMEYKAPWQGTLSISSSGIPFNRNGRSYTWVAYGF